jgi:N-acetylmuramoyl-L-alanine amidase
MMVAAVLAGCGSEPKSATTATTPAPTATARSISIEEIEALAAARRAEEAQQRRNQRLARATPEPVAPADVAEPPIVDAYIPFGAERRQEMAEYANLHYGLNTYRLADPRVIVEHYTVTADAQSAIDLFAPDTPDPELGELPNVCAHYVIDTDGTIYAVVPLEIMCRHTVGLNYTAIGIEHAGFSADEILGNDAQMEASLALTRWLQCRYGIAEGDVIGHNESLSSPYHQERVAELRTQTHQDWTEAEMDVYRERLAATGATC